MEPVILLQSAYHWVVQPQEHVPLRLGCVVFLALDADHQAARTTHTSSSHHFPQVQMLTPASTPFVKVILLFAS